MGAYQLWHCANQCHKISMPLHQHLDRFSRSDISLTLMLIERLILILSAVLGRNIPPTLCSSISVAALCHLPAMYDLLCSLTLLLSAGRLSLTTVDCDCAGDYFDRHTSIASIDSFPVEYKHNYIIMHIVEKIGSQRTTTSPLRL